MPPRARERATRKRGCPRRRCLFACSLLLCSIKARKEDRRLFSASPPPSRATPLVPRGGRRPSADVPAGGRGQETSATLGCGGERCVPFLSFKAEEQEEKVERERGRAKGKKKKARHSSPSLHSSLASRSRAPISPLPLPLVSPLLSPDRVQQRRALDGARALLCARRGSGSEQRTE